MLESLLYVARLELLPDSHPASPLFQILRQFPGYSWPQQVGSIASDFGLGGSFRLQDYDQFPPDTLSAAKIKPFFEEACAQTLQADHFAQIAAIC